MRYRPHDYQEYATRFIDEHPVAALILGMGLGKSVITLTAIEHLMHDSFEVRKVLVIAPLRVAVSTWPDEIRKWDHLSSLTFSVAVGTRDERIAALRRNADITIINRENIPWLIEESGVLFDYDMVVIDELSSFKNHRTKRFRSLMKARPKVKRIVGLTGTPVPNGLMDLWAEFRLLDGGKRLGRFIGQYRERWFLPDKRNQMVVFSYKPKDGAEDEIYSAIADITVSMKAMDRIRMPELIETEMKVSMSKDERKAYDSMKKDLVLSLPDGAVTASNAASLSGKLMQLSSGAVYTDEESFKEIHRRKLDALEDAIESMNGKPLLIAYWFRHERTRISELLTGLDIPWKEISDEASIREWNEGKLQAAIIHPASAGHGLNLQSGGSTLLWFTVPWSLELYQQTVARLWRQGQKEETTVVIHLITEGTIDERVLAALRRKDQTQEALLEAVKADLGIKGGEDETV